MKRLRAVMLAGLAVFFAGQLEAHEQARQPLGPEQLRGQVAALRKEDVAWREIQWRTCLLEGLGESQQQQKPIVLWIFIDRPIDDERC